MVAGRVLAILAIQIIMMDIVATIGILLMIGMITISACH